MFTPDFYIDGIQDAKRTWTHQFIKDPTLNKAAINYINAQTEFAKMLTKNAYDITSYLVKFTSDKFYPSTGETVKAKTAKKADTDINTQGE